MSLSRMFLALLCLLLALLLAILAYLHFANLDRHRARIESIVRDATGRDFSIDGSLDVDLWPGITLQAEKISLANADWGSEPSMLQVGRVEVRVAPLSVVSRPLQVENFELEDVALLMETSEEGVSNWTLEGPPEPEETETDSAEGTRGLGVLVTNAVIRNVVVTQVGPEGKTELVRLEEVTLSPGSDDQLQLAGDGALMAFPLSLQGQLGTRQQIIDSGAADLAMTVGLGALAVNIDGHLAGAEAADKDQLELKLEAEDVAAVIETAGLELPLSGPLSLTATVDAVEAGLNADIEGALAGADYRARIEQRGPDLTADGVLNNLEVLGDMLGVAGLPASEVGVKAAVTTTEAALELGELALTSGDARLSASGRLGTADEKSTLQLLATGSRLTDLLATLPELPFDGKADLSLEGQKILIDPLQFEFGASDIAGNVVLSTGERTTVSAELKSSQLNLTEFAGEEAAPAEAEAPAESTTPAATEAVAAAGSETAVADDAPPGKYVFVEEPLELEPLRTTDADLKLAVQKVVTPGVVLKDLVAGVTLKDGVLDLGSDFQGDRGGVFKLAVGLDASTDQADLKADLKVREMRVNVISGEVQTAEDIPPADITLELAASGVSPREMAAGSNGRLLFTLGPGQMENGVLGAVSGDVFAQLASSLNPLAEQEQYSRLECALMVLSLEDGQGTINPILMQSDKIMVVAGGRIDLDTEKIGVEFNTKPREGVGVSADMFVTPFVALRGTLASPTVGVNETGTLLTAGAAVATGGLSFLAQAALDRASGAMDHCATEMPKPEYQHPALAAE